ncbi:MAG: Ca-activated chloride channel [Verrucomicrobiota bacterium]|nr:Ca-activated chloride channel [Verrucomicrobiota bacterium]MEA3162370.1 Ca-activated chloride channel [Verrucomicrobiota bacterium]
MNSNFRFEQPWFLLLALLLPLFWLVGSRFQRPPVIRFAAARVFDRATTFRRSWKKAVQNAVYYCGCACLIVALARPQLGTATSRIRASGIDIMLLLDVSLSMLSEDFSIGSQRASRLEVVKQVTEKFISGRTDDRIGIIAFSGRAYLVSPLTLDHTWLVENLSRLSIRRIGDQTAIGSSLVEDGTAIGSALATAANRLRDKHAKSRVIVLLTDGDNNAGKIPPLTAAEAAAAIGIKIYTIGAGTNGLVPFPHSDGFGNTYYSQEYMPFKEDTCREIARIGNGIFFRASDTKTLTEIFSQIDHLEKTDVEVQKHQSYEDLFTWLLGGGLCLLGASFVLSETVWSKVP